VAFLAIGVILVSPTSAQLLQRPIAFQRARILTMDGRVIEDGTLLVKGDTIVALGTGVKVPLLAKEIDIDGATITPGLIDPFSGWGGPASGTGTADPTRRAEDAFDRYNTADLVDALRNGVTAVYVSPGGPAGICGTGAVMRLAEDGRESFGQTLNGQTTLCIDLGSASTPVTRLKTLLAVRKQFRDALDYRRSLENYEEDLAEYKKKLKELVGKKKTAKPKDKPKPTAADGKQASEEDKEKEGKEKEEAKKEEGDAKPKKPQRPARNPKLDIVLRAIDREIPVRILTYRSGDILNALELAEEFSFELILEGATEAHLVADQIADAEVPVVLGRMDHSAARRDDFFRRAILDHGAALSRAGVSWIVGSGTDGAARARFVAMNAQLAAARGRGYDPLKLVTADAADTLRVADKIGRLRPGLLADFVVWSGDPLDPASKVLRVYVGGALVYEATDETEKGNTP
jgi:imidazolonepropionase-like amidohydrolase